MYRCKDSILKMLKTLKSSSHTPSRVANDSGLRNNLSNTVIVHIGYVNIFSRINRQVAL